MLYTKKRNYYFTLSILISLVSIGTTLFINIQIAKEYLRVDGKTRALFGITELLQFGYQYYIVILGSISFLLAILTFKNKIQRSKSTLAIILSLFAIAIVFLRIWRFFISSL